jgi:hypothetical protein
MLFDTMLYPFHIHYAVLWRMGISLTLIHTFALFIF